MFDFLDASHAFQLRVFDDHFRPESLMQRDVDVLIDRPGDEKAFVMTVVRGQIRAAPAKGYTQRRTCDNHRISDSSSNKVCRSCTQVIPCKRTAKSGDLSHEAGFFLSPCCVKLIDDF